MEAFHQEGTEDHLEASWEETRDQVGMEAALQYKSDQCHPKGKKKSQLTSTKPWWRHRTSESHRWRAIAWRRSTEVLRSEAKSTRRRSSAGFIRRSDLVNDTLRLVVSQCCKTVISMERWGKRTCTNKRSSREHWRDDFCRCYGLFVLYAGGVRYICQAGVIVIPEVES